MTMTKRVTLIITIAAAVAAATGWILSITKLMAPGIAIFCVALWFLAFIHFRQLWVRAALMAFLLVVLGGGLYGFNAFRAQAINTAFSTMKPPPTAVAVAQAKKEALPRYAPGIGTLQAVHQVTITSEVGALVTKIYFQAGATVKAGDPLVQLNDQPDQGDLANFRAQAKLAELNLARSRELLARQNAAQATVDQNQAQLDQMRASIAKTEAIIAQKLIRAPWDGVLGIRQVEVGQYINAGGTVVSLTDLNTLYVNFTLPEQQRSAIATGQKVLLSVDAYPGRAFEAALSTIEPQIDPGTRSIKVQATLANADHSLQPGMFANIRVVLPPAPEVVTLPATSVDFTLYGDSVFVVREDGKDANGKPVLKVTRTFVKTGERDQNRVAILDGVAPGDQVVISGQLKLQSGTEVVVTPSQALDPPAKLPNT
ncbi:MAG TPA: efflux RND transporter periplasmic adaptor subunit [Stellaceae bacterium]|nr:efflux RND transporter periplasmic adaptor subunit [Stellaceae bacterium]